METNLIKEYTGENISLYFVDYRESLDDHPDWLNKAIQENSISCIWDEIEDSINDASHEEACRLKDEIVELMEEDGIMVSCEDEDDIIDYLKENDDSDVMKDLFRNTSNVICFYSLGEMMPSFPDEEDLKECVSLIKDLLDIKCDDYNDSIETLIYQANGGELRLYFRVPIESLIGDFDTISFSGEIAIAVVDSLQGSGDHIYIDKHLDKVSFKLNRKNLFVDKATRYSYTYDICGMCQDWCEDTVVELTNEGDGSNVSESSMGEHMKIQEKYKETYNNGGCTAEDIDIARHRDVYYKNDYPAGWTCPHCGQFWID